MPVANIRNDYDILIDRRTRWGNPFFIGLNCTREQAIAKHKVWLWGEIKEGRITLEDLAALDGKRLGCHCAPLPCHGDNLVAAAAWAKQQLEKKRGTV